MFTFYDFLDHMISVFGDPRDFSISPSTQWNLLLFTCVIGTIPLLIWAWSIQQPDDTAEHDATKTDPGLLKKHSEFKSYYVPSTKLTYPSIRTFYRAHPQADKLPSKPFPLPLLVFIHGLGGSAAQFAPLLTSLSNVGPCLCIDLPGSGRSEFAPKDEDAYGTQALVRLLAVIVESYRDTENAQGVILIGHSMGCSLAALLASPESKAVGEIPARTIGLIALCPRASSLTPQETLSVNRLLILPTPVFNVLRQFDRRGGTESRSVTRLTGKDAQLETKQLQLRYNAQSKTDVFRRLLKGARPHLVGKGRADGKRQVDGIPPLKVWSTIDLPVFLIAGESDSVTPPKEVNRIASTLEFAWKEHPREDPAGVKEQSAAVENGKRPLTTPKPPRALKTTILPPPAAHSLFFDLGTCRTISGLIQSFLADHIDERLSLGWQLQHLSTEGKWDVKNLAKWRAIDPISEPIAGVFRAMKTMREIDDSHCPKEFVKRWAGEIHAVVDISHESPVYNPKSLDEGGIEYHKFPTVSKLPPTADEVKTFNELIDQLREAPSAKGPDGARRLIAVHCHYGFNRTGFFIVCYLVERMGWRLVDALEEFERVRRPGVKHDYFVDALFVRYAIKFDRRPTLV